jgi:hypothetical protein
MSKSKIPAFADLLAEQVLWQARAASRSQANVKSTTNVNISKIFLYFLFIV